MVKIYKYGIIYLTIRTFKVANCDFKFIKTIYFLRFQIGTSKILDEQKTDGRGGRRTMPYVFTEQGIAMLASVLHSDAAINVSGIMRAFVEMRRFIANNALLFERISSVELKQLEYQKRTDEKLDQIFLLLSFLLANLYRKLIFIRYI